MIINEKIYSLTVETPNGIINIPITHKVVDENNYNMRVTINTHLQNKEITLDAETTSEVLIKLAKTLPDNWNIKSCFSCKYGHFCPVGNANNELFCITDFEPKSKPDLWHITEDKKEREKRSRNLFHLCDMHSYQSENYFTYSDWFPEVCKR